MVQASGALNIDTSPSTLDCEVDFTGGITTLNADLRIVGPATIHDAAVIQGPADLMISVGSSFGGEGDVAVDIVNEGRIEPGFSTGRLVIDSDYEQAPSGSLHIEIGGLADFDVLEITNTAMLDGSLEIILLESYVPELGQCFEIMTWASRTGEFATVDGWLLGEGLYFDLIYNPGGLTLLTSLLLGDVDGDGFVGGEDLSIVLTNWGMWGMSWSQGDQNGDGFVGGSDYSEVLTYWGTSYGPEPVPEPNTLLVLAYGAMATLLRKRGC